jgi:hypothetical protein
MKVPSKKSTVSSNPMSVRLLRQLFVLAATGMTACAVHAQAVGNSGMDDVDVLMPPLRNPSPAPRGVAEDRIAATKSTADAADVATSARAEFDAFREKDKLLTFEAARQPGGVSEPTEFARMRRFLDNRYEGLTVLKTLHVEERVFDCIPLHQQPALRDGSAVAMPPIRDDERTNADSSAGESCAEGGVPLERISAEDMARYPTLRSFLQGNHSPPPSETQDGLIPMFPSSARSAAPTAKKAASSQPHFWQNLRTVPTAITGNGATLNIWNPTTNYFTLEQTWLYGYDSANAVQSLEVGWQKWNGGMPYLFAGSFVGGNYTAAQYSADFVQVSSTTYPGTSYTGSQVSKAGGTQKTLWVNWQWNSSSATWWLWVNNGWVGYFKGSRFGSGPLGLAAMSAQMASGSDNGALHFDVGGEIQNPDTGTPSVPMGSGQFASAGYQQAAFAADIYYYDSQVVRQYTDLTTAIIVVDNPDCYTMSLAGVTPDQFSTPLPRGATTTQLNPLMTRNGLYFGGPGCSN